MKKKILEIGKKSKKALNSPLKSHKKNKVLNDYCDLIKKNKNVIINYNKRDVSYAKNKGIKKNLINRLTLNDQEISKIIQSIKTIIKLKDPTDEILKRWITPKGLNISKISIPIGVIGVIYESRPNVTSDVASLCFKSGNPVILKGGSEAYYSNKILSNLFRKALKKNKINLNYVQFIEQKNHKIVDFILSKMSKYIDVIIPRGGKNLVKKVQSLSRIPVIGHLEGVCHTYIDLNANIKLAQKVVSNAKLRNTAICGATETILVHKKILKKFCDKILINLQNKGCKIIAEKKIKKYFKGKFIVAKKKDWSKEYLAPIVSVKIVNNFKDAIKHINQYGTMHTDAIITKNTSVAKIFLKEVKSSIAMQNTSTQFADGGEFGFGGEVGISTNTLPPRGPIGLNQLVSYKYQVTSNGKIRK